jgi:hydrogenase nickel incorporation protein HypA/HybF
VHEVGLVAEVVEVVERAAGGRPVERVRIRRATTIPEDVLEQAWTMLVEGGPLAGAVLEVTPFEIRAACACGFEGPLEHDDVVAQGIATCPSCGAVVTFPPTPELEIVEIVAATG